MGSEPFGCAELSYLGSEPFGCAGLNYLGSEPFGCAGLKYLVFLRWQKRELWSIAQDKSNYNCRYNCLLL